MVMLRNSIPLWILLCSVSSISAFAQQPQPFASSSSEPKSSSFAAAAAASASVPSTTKSEDYINLQAQHQIVSPAERMKQIASRCEDLGISNFDQYGDYQKSPSTSFLRKFENEVAKTFGKEDAVFMPSGVMAQSIALMIHSKTHQTKRTNDNDDATMNNYQKGYQQRFACHHTSHLLLWEEDSYKELLDMDVVEISTKHDIDVYDDGKNDANHNSIHVPPMGYQDVHNTFMKEKEHYNIRNDVDGDYNDIMTNLGQSGLSTLIIELPHRELGGKRTPWDDVLQIQKLCVEEGIKFHCDGARIFEASAGYGLSLSEMASVFDSVYISFYKGLGAISGAMLIGDKAFCDEARVWLRRFGGNLYTLLPYAVDSWDGFQKNVSEGNIRKFHQRYEKMQALVQGIQSLNMSTRRVDEVVVFDPSFPETNMVHVYLKASVEHCEKARDIVKAKTGVLVFNRLRKIETSDPLHKLGFASRFEWTIGEANFVVENEIFIDTWKMFIDELKHLKQ